MKNLFKLIYVFVVFIVCSLVKADEANKVNIVASIKPIQLIAKAIVQKKAVVDLLVPKGESPHAYRLRPSDIQKINKARVLFWIGPEMEVFLSKVIKSTNIDSVVLITNSLISLQKYTNSVALKDNKAESKNCGCKHKDEHKNAHDHEHVHGELDSHIWLSPMNSIAIAEIIMNKVSTIDPKNQDFYMKNFEVFKKKIIDIDLHNQKAISVVHDKPIYVFHDAYGYLQSHYALNIAGYFTVNPEQSPSADFLKKLRTKIKGEKHHVCVFKEPQFNVSYIKKITHGLNVKIAELDPLASEIDINDHNGYVNFLSKLIESISVCLQTTIKE